MTFQPRSTDNIYGQLRDSLTSRINRLTNFVDGSFNDAFVESYSEEVREAELKALAAELAGLVDYAGKDLTQADLDRLGKDNVEPEEINQFMKEIHLDRLAANFGVTRNPGAKATAEVEIEVGNDSVRVEEGMTVGTQPDSDGDYLQFYVDADGDGEIDEDSGEYVTAPDGTTTVTASVIADSSGTEYNVPAGSITYMPNPQPGIQSVTNPAKSDGGTNEQTTPELRTDAREAIFKSSDGGTTLGIESYIEDNTNNAVEVNVDQYTDFSPPFVDVVIVGSNDDAYLKELIEDARPVGIRHYLARPSRRGIGIFTHIDSGEDVDFISSQIRQYVDGIEMGDPFNWSGLLQKIITSTESSSSVLPLVTYVNTVEKERKLFDSTQNIYTLNDGPLGRVTNEKHIKRANVLDYETVYDAIIDSSVVVDAVIDGQRQELVNDTDYDVIDADGDGDLDTISLNSGLNITDTTTLRINYNHNLATFGSVTSDGTTYTQGTDYALIDNDGDGVDDAIDWSIGGDSPADGDFFQISYEPRSSFEGNLQSNDRQLFEHDQTRIQTYNS